ncbi:O-fucosyltransferase family protein [Haloarcula salina]|uniref:Glycosyl transferase family 11 n=1 Tax=Haloarcula salina TaxID=1429914 RepID=A0AA41FXH8_9EURY|nr:hypothetical protein [Haloarcula salina]MBV0900411.1 hypothetical protein [Haloarcula salina]
MTKHLIYTHGGGRLGNQLVNYANLLAFELENPDVDVLDLAIHPHIDQYGSPVLPLGDIREKSPDGLWQAIIRYGWGDGVVERILKHRPLNGLQYQMLHRVANLRTDAQSMIGGNTHAPFSVAGDSLDRVDLDDAQMIRQLKSKRVSVLAGWGVRCWSLVEKYRDRIRDHLQPAPVYLDTARSYIDSLQSSHDFVVGVLIRQGDYRTWNDGRYFFTSPEYRELLQKFEQQHAEKDVCFVIASDESQDDDLFKAESYRFATGDPFGSGHYLENFAELSLCDAVLTPPSTFSTFAAFLGDCPLVPLYDSVVDHGFEQLDRPLLDSLDDEHMSQSIK